MNAMRSSVVTEWLFQAGSASTAPSLGDLAYYGPGTFPEAKACKERLEAAALPPGMTSRQVFVMDLKAIEPSTDGTERQA